MNNGDQYFIVKFEINTVSTMIYQLSILPIKKQLRSGWFTVKSAWSTNRLGIVQYVSSDVFKMMYGLWEL